MLPLGKEMVSFLHRLRACGGREYSLLANAELKFGSHQSASLTIDEIAES